MRPLLLTFLLALAVAGCDTGGPTEKTYPSAESFPAVAVVDLFEVAPGRYNVEAVVVQVSVCPPDAICEIPDSILVADAVYEDPVAPAFTLFVEDARQFREGGRYRFSVEAFDADGGPPYAIRLLGYDRL
ncbi:hypothetical protein [Rubrivirga sp.]|uniref:hypothetical protein n=1 Tax=Rubrivirga sp. TaxID=1885344 RepID=UPI003B519D68